MRDSSFKLPVCEAKLSALMLSSCQMKYIVSVLNPNRRNAENDLYEVALQRKERSSS